MSVDPSFFGKSFCRIVTVAQPPPSCSLLLCRFIKRSVNMSRLRLMAVSTVLALGTAGANAQSSVGGKMQTKEPRPSPIQVVHEVRSYRQANEDHIMRELRELLAIPNVAGDTANIQKNADHLKELLEARGIETHLL